MVLIKIGSKEFKVIGKENLVSTKPRLSRDCPNHYADYILPPPAAILALALVQTENQKNGMSPTTTRYHWIHLVVL